MEKLVIQNFSLTCLQVRSVISIQLVYTLYLRHAEVCVRVCVRESAYVELFVESFTVCIVISIHM